MRGCIERVSGVIMNYCVWGWGWDLVEVGVVIENGIGVRG